MTFEIYTNRAPFGLLNDDQQAALKAHPGPWVFMDPSDLRDGSAPDWTEIDGADWWPEFVYCAVRPVPEPFWIAPEVWRVLDAKWRWAAADANGDIAIYELAEPFRGPDMWRPHDGGDWASLRTFAPHLIRRGTVPWNQSLIERPSGL